MGQLEKYGLYVLCLVIFLILGVAIFADGNGPAKAGAPAPTALNGGPIGASSRGADDKGRTPAPVERRAALLGDGNLANLALGRDPQGGQNQEPKPSPELPKTFGNGAGQPAPTPAPAPAPLDSVRPTYKVKAGDSFEKIARTQLGNPALHTEIAKLNPKVEPTRLMLDQELVLPSKQDLAAVQKGATTPKTEATPKAEATSKTDSGKGTDKASAGAKAERAATAGGPRTHTIVKGDTFEGIAVRELGSKRRVDEIRQLNPDLNPTNLKVGTVVRLPAR